MVSERTISVEVPGAGPVTAIASDAIGDSGWQFIYAPGAGSNVHDPFGTYACRALAEQGIECLRFHFPYHEAGKKSPDRLAILEGTWRAVIAATRAPGRKLIVGGRSMGGRISSQVVVAVNNDPECPLFEISDFAVVGDLADVLPQAAQAIREHRDAQA